MKKVILILLSLMFCIQSSFSTSPYIIDSMDTVSSKVCMVDTTSMIKIEKTLDKQNTKSTKGHSEGVGRIVAFIGLSVVCILIWVSASSVN